MSVQTRCSHVHRALALVAFLSIAASVQAQSATPPSSVSALIYSRTAIELFWTPNAGQQVEVSRNGDVLGQYDARSLFQPNLRAGEQYNYALRSINSDGSRSNPVVLTLSTANFSLPIKRVYSVNGDNTQQEEEISPPPPQPIIEAAAEPEKKPEPTVVATPPLNDDQSASAITQTNSNCLASDVSSLLACIRNANAYSRVDLTQDITCTNNCCPNGDALLRLSGIQNLELAGNGRRLLRTVGQRQCGLLDIDGASNIQVSNLRLDDDQRVVGCQTDDRCPRMVHIRNAKDIRFNQTHISHGKGYAFYVQGTDGFKFENGSLTNSGVLGMYVGHGNDSSTNIRITNSTFADNQTNGLALLGVHGQSLDSNVVADNLFIRNHRRGQWPVRPQYGTGFTGGGQFYVAQANNVTVRNNVVKDGYCDNCYVQRKYRSGVSGIELGLPNRASVSNVDVTNNTVVNHDGFGISQNSNSSLSNVRILNNQLLNTTSGEHVSGAQKSGNRVLNTQRFDSFESGSDVGGVFKTAVSCSSSGAVTRRCGADSRFGQCAAQLQLGSADCSDTQAELIGPNVSVSEGQSVVADGWVQNPVGRWCLVFRDGSGNKLSEQCKNIADTGRSIVQSFVGLPSIDARSPDGSSSVQLRITHSQPNTAMLVDDLKLSVGD